MTYQSGVGSPPQDPDQLLDHSRSHGLLQALRQAELRPHAGSQAALYSCRNARERLTGPGPMAPVLLVVQQREEGFRETGEVPLGHERLVAEGVAAARDRSSCTRRRVEGVQERARPVVDCLARDRHVVRVHHAVHESDEHPLGGSVMPARPATASNRARARLSVGRSGWWRGDRVIDQPVEQGWIPVARAYWKLPTRRWLHATRVSTAPGRAVSRWTRLPSPPPPKSVWWGFPARACPH